jgi:hypothetical protein
MSDDHGPESRRRVPEASALILQIDRSIEGSPQCFPAIVRNLVDGVVTLEINNLWAFPNWETLKGRGGCLKLHSGNGGVTDLQGTVTWSGYTALDLDRGQLHLGLKLADPSSAQKLLSSYLPHITEDIKSLWERWDQAREAPEPAALSAKTSFAAMSLLTSGLALQLVWPQPYKLFAWVLWLFGTLLVGGQTLHFWKCHKASR